MSLLDALSSEHEPATLKTLSQATGLHPSTAHRILGVMAHAESSSDTKTAPMRWASACWNSATLSNRASTSVRLPDPSCRSCIARSAKPSISESATRTNCLCRAHLKRSFVGTRCLSCRRASPAAPDFARQAVLAADSTSEIRAYAKRTGLPGKTEHSLTSLDALERISEKVRPELAWPLISKRLRSVWAPRGDTAPESLQPDVASVIIIHVVPSLVGTPCAGGLQPRLTQLTQNPRRLQPSGVRLFSHCDCYSGIRLRP